MAGRDIEENPESDWHMKTRGWRTAVCWREEDSATRAFSLTVP
jgi:hypothetical protein